MRFLYKIFFILLITSGTLFAMDSDMNFNHQANRSKFNGNVAEDFMSKYFKNTGWKQLPGEVGSNGIDGLFVKTKNGVIKDVMFVESKFKSKGIPTMKDGEISISKSGVGTTKDGAKQMSKTWSLKKIDNLINKGDPKLREYYKQIRKHVVNGSVRKRYFSFTKLADGKISTTIERIEDVGKNEIKIQRGNRKASKLTSLTFDPKNPKTSFEKKLAGFYNESMKAEKKVFIEAGKASKIAQNASKNFTKLATKASKYGGGKIIAKMGALSAASAIPVLGVAAQVAADMYMAYQIEELGKATEKNANDIAENRNNIINNVNKIAENKQLIHLLGQQVGVNQQNIERAFNQIDDLNKQMQDIEKQLQIDRDSKFKTGIEELKNYFDSNKEDNARLISAIGKFDEILNNKNYSSSVQAITLNSLNIAEIEQVYFKRKNDENTSELEKKIINNFNNIIKTKNLAIIGNAFDSMQYIFIDDANKSTQIQNMYLEYLDGEIKTAIDNHHFEDALYMANLAKSKLGNTKIYDEVLSQREANFQKERQKLTNEKNIKEILKHNQNYLLNKEAVRVAYNQDNIKLMIYILQNYHIDENFRLKAFYRAYEITDSDKADEICKLILNNPSYSDNLKNLCK